MFYRREFFVRFNLVKIVAKFYILVTRMTHDAGADEYSANAAFCCALSSVKTLL